MKNNKRYLYKKKWAEDNRSKMAAYRRKYRLKNAEKIRSYNLEHKRANKGRANELRRLNRKLNREKYLAARRRYYAHNKERITAQNRATRNRNLEKYRSHGRKSYHKLKVKRAIQNRAWKARNRDVIREKLRLYRKKNRHRIRETTKRLYASNPNYMVRSRVSSRIYKLLNNAGYKKRNKTHELLGTSLNGLRAHLESLFKPGMAWKNRSKWHIDHKRPCASFDLTDPEQQKQCFHYTNLQPLWVEENQAKGAKIDWLPAA